MHGANVSHPLATPYKCEVVHVVAVVLVKWVCVGGVRGEGWW